MTPKVEVLTAGFGQNRLCSVNVYNILQSSLGVLARNINWLHIKKDHKALGKSPVLGMGIIEMVNRVIFLWLFISNHCK